MNVAFFWNHRCEKPSHTQQRICKAHSSLWIRTQWAAHKWLQTNRQPIIQWHKRASKQQQKRKKKVREWIMGECVELYSWWGKIFIINKNFRASSVYKEDMELKQSGLTRKTSFRWVSPVWCPGGKRSRSSRPGITDSGGKGSPALTDTLGSRQ